MSHTFESTPVYSPLQAEVMSSAFVQETTEVCAILRRAAHAPTVSASIEGVREAVSRLVRFTETFERTAGRESAASQVLRPILGAVGDLIKMSPESSAFPREILVRMLLLEQIPSQVVAGVEQSAIDRGEAPSRMRLLNEVIRRRQAKSYLEIGCCNNDCFNAISCPQKVGVDPGNGGTLRMTSDQFFEVNVQKFDVIFIDGLHEAWQVDKDIQNALAVLNPNGVIVMHDCNPVFEVRAIVPRCSDTWNGDVWKSLVRARSFPGVDCATGLFDHGCGVICPRPNSAPLALVGETDLTWSNLEANRAAWLRPMDFDQILAWIG